MVSTFVLYWTPTYIVAYLLSHFGNSDFFFQTTFGDKARMCIIWLVWVSSQIGLLILWCGRTADWARKQLRLETL